MIDYKLDPSLIINKILFLTFFRLQRLEESLKDEPEEQKSEKRAQHAVKETEFLRLKRSKISVEDFDPIKVIGRGAFGEVSDGWIWI